MLRPGLYIFSSVHQVKHNSQLSAHAFLFSVDSSLQIEVTEDRLAREKTKFIHLCRPVNKKENMS